MTGRRRRSRQTVPGAAWSPIASPPLLFPGFPTRRNRWPPALPMASVPVRTGWKRLSGAGFAGCGARSEPRPHLAGGGGRCPPPGPQSLAPRPGRPRLPRCCPAGGSVQPRPGSGRSPSRRTASGILGGSRGAPASESPGGFFKSAEAGAPRAPVTARRPGAREPAFQTRCPRAASQVLAVLSSANRGCCRFCGGRGRPASPGGAARARSCGASCRRTHRPWPLPGRTPREGTACIPDPPNSGPAPAFTP